MATAADIAKEMRVSASQVRRWADDGCPVVNRGRPMQFDLAAVRAWRAGQHADLPERIGHALLETMRRDAGRGAPAHRELGFSDRSTAVLLLFAFDRVHRELLGRDPVAPLPESVRVLRVLAGAPPDL